MSCILFSGASYEFLIEKSVAELRAKYPKAKGQEGFKTSAARAAANLRAELSGAFPGIKFEIKSKSYAGGNSINVSYTDGPAYSEVEKIAKKYQDGDFNEMEDIHEYDSSAYGQAFDIVCGRAKYVSVERNYSADAMQAAVDKNAIHWGNAFEVKVAGDDGHAYVEHDYTRELQRRALFELLRVTDLRC